MPAYSKLQFARHLALIVLGVSITIHCRLYYRSLFMVRIDDESQLSAISCTGWPKSKVSKVQAYCSASDHLIRKIFRECVGTVTGLRNI